MLLTAYTSFAEFRKAAISCPSCGWSGRGCETDADELDEPGLANGYHCPRCSAVDYVSVAMASAERIPK
jgi:hypothetical protein